MKPERSWNRILALLFSLTMGTRAAIGASPEDSLFELQVRPLLADKCFKCHSHDADKIKSGLVLDSLAGALQGGDSGKPAIVPHEPTRSELLNRIRSTEEKERMPPKGERLTAKQTSILEEWIRQGAPWSQLTTGLSKRPRGPITDEDRSWWAFQPLANVKIPHVKDASWARTDIDRFIFEKLAVNRLTPTPQASRPVLIRRLYFDLWGLPPSAREIDEFVTDSRPDADEALVDRLLASPHYGERWARHWLDLVRYADSDGYKADDFRPTAWMYRDYVIHSLNADRPYDRFVREQLAGDELYPDEPDARIATGYLRNGIYEYNNRDVAGQWTTILNDVTDTTGDVFFGLGFQCARCHDHKFDPILQKDYYRLQAFFAGIQWHDDFPVTAAAQNPDYVSMQMAWEEKTATLRDAIETIEAPYKAKAATNAILKFPPEIQAILRRPSGERSPLEQQLGELAYRQISYEHDRISSSFKPADKEAVAELRKELSIFDGLRPAPLPTTLTVTDLGTEASPTVIPKRTNEIIEPGFLTLFDPGPAPIRRLTQSPNSTGRRAALAEWLTRPNNPLSARVIVNRVWQYHFGRGLVPTSSDFGHLGEKPSHPELLDWLAQRFITDGWSLKKLHRLMLTSATYRQASSVESMTTDLGRRSSRARELATHWKQNQTGDPENRLLWRGQTRRLDAEQIRDALLSATAELKMEPIESAADASQFRRSIYTKVLRNTRDPLLDVFDVPQHFSSTPSRDTTTTPVQSLMLINSSYMLQRSRAMARRFDAESAGNSAHAVELAYLAAFGRRPTSSEVAAAEQFLKEQQHRVDPELALSASAGFLSDRIPFRDGRAALMAPRSSQETLSAPLQSLLPSGDFTIEAFVYLRSASDEKNVRTIASRLDGTNASAGWALGVTAAKTSRRPQTLALQLYGLTASNQPVSDEVLSDLRIQMDKPYYVGASVQFQVEHSTRITFYLKDLSNDEEPLLVTQVRTDVADGMDKEQPLTLGGRPGNQHLWDGLIDDVRLTLGALPREELELTREGVTEGTVGLWQFEAKPSYFRDASVHQNDIRPVKAPDSTPLDARTLALADLCHALLNANEFLYVE